MSSDLHALLAIDRPFDRLQEAECELMDAALVAARCYPALSREAVLLTALVHASVEAAHRTIRTA